MKKEDLNSEIISKMELIIDNTLFYMPGETIKGKIIMNPQFKMKIEEKTIHLSLKIMQYEFWDYNKVNIKELKNIYTTTIQQEDIEYRLKEEETSTSQSFMNFSVIEKEEDKNKNITIPFQIKINNPKILPTFQFEDKKYILGIRHLLLVECHEYYSSNYMGLFIGKNKNEDFSEPKELKGSFRIDISTLEVTANIPKLSYKFNEEIQVDVKTKSNLHFKKITEILQKLYRKIEWIGYMKNTVLDRNVINEQKLTYNENKYKLSTKLKLPFNALYTSLCEGLKVGNIAFNFTQNHSLGDRIGKKIKEKVEDALEENENDDDNDNNEDIDTNNNNYKKNYKYKKNNNYNNSNDYNEYDNAIGSLALGAAAAPFGMIYGLFKGIYKQGDVVKDILNLHQNQNNIESKFSNKLENEVIEKEYIENLKKFVYFNKDKIVGFIKFSKNILPPVKGYYFKCNYNIKIEVQVAGIITNSNKELKTQIDLYDYEEYIEKMKEMFKN